jgi:hypothetical protein
MAYAAVIMQVYLNEHGHGVVTCRQCGVTGRLTLAESRDTIWGHPCPITCEVCRHVFQVYFVCRRHRRESVQLPGLLYTLHPHQPLDTITITSLSASGISFRTRHRIGCHLGERYAVMFGRTEQDHRMGYRAIVITRIQGQVVGAAFTPLPR